MGDVQPPKPVMMLVAAFSRHPSALDWAQQQLEAHYGAISLSSDRFEFDQTTYYETEMGGGLLKQFHLIEPLADPAQLPTWKRVTNQWEDQVREAGDYKEARPLNLDPGYLTEAKLVLATTKDRDHRIYLEQGIYAEVTLYFNRGQWQSRPWTYPDYQLPSCHAFLDRGRSRLRELMRETRGI